MPSTWGPCCAFLTGFMPPIELHASSIPAAAFLIQLPAGGLGGHQGMAQLFGPLYLWETWRKLLAPDFLPAQFQLL